MTMSTSAISTPIVPASDAAAGSHDEVVWELLEKFDRYGPVPLYRQITDAIGEAIRRGDLAHGVVLPSMVAMSRRLDVGLSTVRRSYRLLCLGDLVHIVGAHRSVVGPAESPRRTGGAEESSAVPRYRRIADEMVSRIRSGVIEAHRKLPSQLELAREFVVSLGTSRGALRWLQAEGWIYTLAGKGSFAVPKEAWPQVEEGQTAEGEGGPTELPGSGVARHDESVHVSGFFSGSTSPFSESSR
ncbi:GntR family transcriptional regulator [Streptosporangiaceae bacterium NEAU-GS5]|nr:GntR family transcriptional regulator [Streptosporangiaceae bacterium NEAU-GS5]